MTLTLELSPEQEARLKAEAKRRGTDEATAALQIIDQTLPRYGYLWDTLSDEEWIAHLREWSQSQRTDTPLLSDENLRRENMYDDRGL